MRGNRYTSQELGENDYYFILFQIVVSVYQWEDFSRHLFLEMCQESRVKDERPGGCCCWRNSGQY